MNFEHKTNFIEPKRNLRRRPVWVMCASEWVMSKYAWNYIAIWTFLILEILFIVACRLSDDKIKWQFIVVHWQEKQRGKGKGNRHQENVCVCVLWQYQKKSHQNSIECVKVCGIIYLFVGCVTRLELLEKSKTNLF